MKTNVIDLFCGIGGFSLGAARAGLNVICAIDNNSEAISAHRLNFKATSHIEADISHLTTAKINNYFTDSKIKIDGVIGGPPCQGFSVIGKNNITDPRNGLFTHFFRLVSDLKPQFYIAENVPGILNERNDGLRKRAISYVKSAYETFPPIALIASDFGAATLRKRIFFIGIRRDVKHKFKLELLSSYKSINKVFVNDALKGLPIKINPKWQSEQEGWRRLSSLFDGDFGKHLFHRIPTGVGNAEAISRLNNRQEVSGCLGTVHNKEVIKRIARLAPGAIDPISRAQRLDPLGYCPTLRAGTDKDHGSFQAVRPFHPSENRVITPREAARLQGFPDWFVFSPTKWHSFRQIGNSISPILAESILRMLVNSLI